MGKGVPKGVPGSPDDMGKSVQADGKMIFTHMSGRMQYSRVPTRLQGRQRNCLSHYGRERVAWCLLLSENPGVEVYKEKF